MRNINTLVTLGFISLMAAADTAGAAQTSGRNRNRADSDGNNTDTKGDAPFNDEPTIINPENPSDSTLQVTETARKYLVDKADKHTVQAKSVKEIGIEGDAIQAFIDVLGTTNVNPGKIFPALRSNVYSAPNGKGQRAMYLTQDGKVTFLPNGTKYAQAYEETKRAGGMMAIAYFDQSDNATNPHVRVSYYTLKELPVPSGNGTGKELF